jgi:hypothetical protein
MNRWMQIRRIELKTADGLSPLPMSSAWVRDGLFLIGMDSEFAVYSQWRGREETALSNADTRTSSGKDFVDHRHLPEADLLNMAQVRFWLDSFAYCCQGINLRLRTHLHTVYVF